MGETDCSYEEILRCCGDTVYKIAINQMRNTQDAEDVFQEVFLRLVRAAPNLSNAEHRKAWLIRVTINICRDMQRAQARRQKVDWTDLPTQSQQQDPPENILFDYVMRLPSKYSSVLHLFYYEDMSVEQIASVTSASASAVKSQLSRGRKKLKSLLEQEAPQYEWYV